MTEAAWSTSAPAIRIERSAPARIRVLRMRRTSDDALRRFAEATGLPLPEPNMVTADGAVRVLWIGLHEWLIVGDTALDALAGSVAASHVADITDGIVAYRIAGDDAPTVLAKGCTLDLHRRTFPALRCAQTAFAQVAVTIERLSDDTFTLYADRSYARHLDLWFDDAAVEFRAMQAIA